MLSQTLPIYTEWLETATPKQIETADALYAECEEHYDDGGDTIVECYAPDELLAAFKEVKSVRKLCGHYVGQALNARWGEDNDPEVQRSRNFHDNWGPEDDRDPNTGDHR